MQDDRVTDESDSPPSAAIDSANYRDLIDRYADYAPVYDRRFANYSRQTLAMAVDGIPEREVERLIDVACGTGLLGEMLRRERPGLSMLGVDISPDMVEVARHRFTDEPYQWAVGQAESLPADDNSFDVLTCNNAFHLVERPMDGLIEFKRVLKPGGRLVLVDWCREYLTMYALHRWLRMVGKHRREVRTVREQTDLIRAAGFEIDSAERFKASWFWGLMRLVAHKPQ